MRRVESCFPIIDPVLAQRVFDEALALYLDDNLTAWELQSDGGYRKLSREADAPARSAQSSLLAKLCG